MTEAEALQKAKEDYEKAKAIAKARYDRDRSRHLSAFRKKDTRRKIILGAALMDLAAKEDRAQRMIAAIIGTLTREQDRKVFEDWTPPAPGKPDPASETADNASGEKPRRSTRFRSAAQDTKEQSTTGWGKQDRRDRWATSQKSG